MIKNTSVQESCQVQLANPMGASDLMGDEVTVCDICGDEGRVKLLAICNKCTDGAEHTYCMRDMLDKVPEGWMCEECMMRSECQKSKSSVNLESSSSSKLKFKSSRALERKTEGISSTSDSSAKRPRVQSEAWSVKHNRVIKMSDEAPMSSKDFTSELQISCNSQKKAEVLNAYGDKRCANTLEIELDEKRKTATFPKGSKPTNQSLLKKLGKANMKQSSYGSREKPKLPSHLGNESPTLGSQTEIARVKCSLLKSGSSKISDVKIKGQLAKVGYLPKRKVEKNIAIHDTRKGKNLGLLSKSVSSDNASSVKLNGTCSEVVPANAYRPVVFKNSSSSEETKATKRKYVSHIQHPAMCLLDSESGVAAAKSENRTISRNETLISGSNCCRLDAVQSCGQVDCRLPPNSHKAHKDMNCLNEDKKNESWQAERPTEAAAAMKLHELCTCLGYDKKCQFEAATLSDDIAIPNPDYIWQGKFQIHRGEGIASTCVGIPAHVSTYASQEVLTVVDRLPDIIVLEELPRLKIWPSQFMESQATVENIVLYFFAKDLYSYGTCYRGLIEYMSKDDLALKGNLDGVELLIFPSNVLPEKSQCWNEELFLWGVFRERKIDNSANTPVSDSQKQENRDIVRSMALDLNVNPEDGNEVVEVHETGGFDGTDTRSSGGRILLGGGDSNNSVYSDVSQSLDGKEKTSESVLHLGLSLRPKSPTPEVGPWLSVGNVYDKPNKDVKGKMPMEENNNADNVMLLGKLLMDKKNNADRPESSLSFASPTSYEENLDMLHWQAVETLFSLSQD